MLIVVELLNNRLYPKEPPSFQNITPPWNFFMFFTENLALSHQETKAKFQFILTCGWVITCFANHSDMCWSFLFSRKIWNKLKIPAMAKQVEPTIAQPQKISDIKLSDGSLGGYGGLMKKACMMLAPKKPIAPRMPPATLPSRILGLNRLS